MVNVFQRVRFCLLFLSYFYLLILLQTLMAKLEKRLVKSEYKGFLHFLFSVYIVYCYVFIDMSIPYVWKIIFIHIINTKSLSTVRTLSDCLLLVCYCLSTLQAMLRIHWLCNLHMIYGLHGLVPKPEAKNWCLTLSTPKSFWKSRDILTLQKNDFQMNE